MDITEVNQLENSYLELLQPSSAKVLALYQAVGSLISEGADLTGLKVAEIAARAGIGKGTTYDYFSSREELIVRAVQYNVFRHLLAIWEKLEKAPGFKEKVFLLLDEIFTPEKEDQKLFEQMFLFVSNRRTMPEKFEKALNQCASDKNVFRIFCYKMIRFASEEGICKEELPEEYAEASFISLMVSYGLFVGKCRCEAKTMDFAKVKERLYENLLFALRSE